MSMRPLVALVRKDLLVFFTDRRAVILSFAAPLVLASFFATVFGGGGGASGSGASTAIAVSVADLDSSPLSIKIVTALTADPSLEIEVVASEHDAKELVRNGKATVAVVIPRGFAKQSVPAMFGGGDKPDLFLFRDPTRVAEVGMVRGMLTQHVMQAVSSEAFSVRGLTSLRDRIGALDGAAMPAADRAALRVLLQAGIAWADQGAKSGGAGPAFSLPYESRELPVTVGGQEEKALANSHAFGGMAVQFILFAAIEAGVGLITERQKGLWRRLRSAPVAKSVLLLGRGVSGTIISLMILAVIFGFGALTFHIRITGSVVGFALVCLAYAAMAASFGLLVATLGKTPQAARGLTVMVVLFMVMLGGAWIPTFLFPGWLQSLTPIVPTRWAVDGFDATLARGFTLTETIPTVLALFGFTAAFSVVAFARFRWDVD